jgi:hypothetical protein
MWERFKHWYEGEFVPRANDPGSPLVFLNGGHYRRSVAARALRVVAEFYVLHWKWVIPIVVTVALALFLRPH